MSDEEDKLPSARFRVNAEKFQATASKAELRFEADHPEAVVTHAILISADCIVDAIDRLGETLETTARDILRECWAEWRNK